MKSEFLRAMNFRHACRRFDPDRQVSDEDLRFILECGRLSPSSIGLEHWKFVVTRDASLKKALRRACMDQAQVSDCSVVVVVLARIAELDPDGAYVSAQFERLGLSAREQAGMREFYRSYLRSTDLAAWSVSQCHIAAANMMTGAAAVGIDSCPVGGFDAVQLRHALGIPAGQCEAALVLPFGYRAGGQPPRHRRTLAELVEFR